MKKVALILALGMLGCSGMKNELVRRTEALPDTIGISEFNYVPLFSTIYNYCGRAELGRRDVNGDGRQEDFVCGGDTIFFVNIYL
ncbi:MAG: hypothetical protein UU06_C0017G0001 [Parcubacteria group bacterium GW2011_GWB1_40_5]|nr:MAG: hypothetical protein UU06_C0017G0001 [Parcubacteria group bacterium GW2011_GWB1_40_5]